MLLLLEQSIVLVVGSPSGVNTGIPSLSPEKICQCPLHVPFPPSSWHPGVALESSESAPRHCWSTSTGITRISALLRNMYQFPIIAVPMELIEETKNCVVGHHRRFQCHSYTTVISCCPHISYSTLTFLDRPSCRPACLLK